MRSTVPLPRGQGTCPSPTSARVRPRRKRRVRTLPSGLRRARPGVKPRTAERAARVRRGRSALAPGDLAGAASETPAPVRRESVRTNDRCVPTREAETKRRPPEPTSDRGGRLARVAGSVRAGALPNGLPWGVRPRSRRPAASSPTARGPVRVNPIVPALPHLPVRAGSVGQTITVGPHVLAGVRKRRFERTAAVRPDPSGRADPDGTALLQGTSGAERAVRESFPRLHERGPGVPPVSSASGTRFTPCLELVSTCRFPHGSRQREDGPIRPPSAVRDDVRRRSLRRSLALERCGRVRARRASPQPSIVDDPPSRSSGLSPDARRTKPSWSARPSVIASTDRRRSFIDPSRIESRSGAGSLSHVRFTTTLDQVSASFPSPFLAPGIHEFLSRLSRLLDSRFRPGVLYGPRDRRRICRRRAFARSGPISLQRKTRTGRRAYVRRRSRPTTDCARRPNPCESPCGVDSAHCRTGV